MEGVPHADDALALVGEERDYLSLLGVMISPLACWRDGSVRGVRRAETDGSPPGWGTLTELPRTAAAGAGPGAADSSRRHHGRCVCGRRVSAPLV